MVSVHCFKLSWLSRTLLLENHEGQGNGFPETINYGIIYISRILFTGEFKGFINKFNIEGNTDDTHFKDEKQSTGEQASPIHISFLVLKSADFVGVSAELT